MRFTRNSRVDRFSRSQISGAGGGGGAGGITLIKTGQSGSLVNTFSLGMTAEAGDVVVVNLYGWTGSFTAVPSGNARSYTGHAVSSQQMGLVILAAGDTAIEWPESGPPDFGQPARYAWALWRGCDPVTPVSSRTSGGNGTAGLNLTAARDASLNVQSGTFGGGSSLVFTGGGFAAADDGVTAITGSGGFTGSINFLAVDIADGANGSAGSYANTAVRGAMMLQPPA